MFIKAKYFLDSHWAKPLSVGLLKQKSKKQFVKVKAIWSKINATLAEVTNNYI